MKSKWKIPNLPSSVSGELIFDRSTIITPALVEKIIYAHNGYKFVKVSVTSEHVGHKVGEFALTKVSGVYKRSLKKSK